MPVIAAVLNAASYALTNGPYGSSSVLNNPTPFPAVSPGEVISIFGYALGPSTPLGLQLDSTGKVMTTLGGVQVLFNGVAAPLTYVSATQINCVVPYEFNAGALPSTPGATSNPEGSVQVEYLSQILPLSLRTTNVSPGIFTTTGTGTGQAAALNSDGSVNSASNPAAAGSTVAVYMTGEGQTNPPGIDGAVTCSSGCATINQIPMPINPLFALVDESYLGQDLGWSSVPVPFYGEAPSLVSGVMQVNVEIPLGTPSGPLPLQIEFAGMIYSQVVTIAVK
jgi:uncharacterized protein (TIGR03437 family)